MEVEEIELRSDEVQEILSDVPNWMIRWGNTLFLFLIGLLLFLAWFIRYPDTVTGAAKITTEEPPRYIVNKVSGVIEKLTIETGHLISADDFIAEIQSPSNIESITELSHQVKLVRNYLNHNRGSLVLKEEGLILGDAQSEYSRLLSLVKEYRTFLGDPYYGEKIQKLKTQIGQYNRMSSINLDERSISEKDLALARERLETKRKLYDEELIAKMELLEEESSFKRLEQSFSGSRKGNVQNDITIAEYEKQIADLEYERKDRRRQYKFQIEQALSNLENMVNNWGQTYTITAPISGELTFLTRLKEQQFVNAGDTLLAVIPNSTDYIVEVLIPAAAVGKVKTGQEVQLKIENYPYGEYGQVIGSIESIAPISKSRSYFATVKLENGLNSTYNQKLDYSPDMLATASIITEDLNLLDRIFKKFNEMVKK